MDACCLYYTAHRHRLEIEQACRRQLDKARGNLPLVAVGLQPFVYGDITVSLYGKAGPLMLHKQILTGLRLCEGDVVFFCENDSLYHRSHLAFTPPQADSFWYNTNVWRVRYSDGHAVWTDDLQQTSGLCAHRDLLLAHYDRRVAEIERDGFDRHYEPGPKTSDHKALNWVSEWPLVDIRHDANMTRSKWAPEQFRNQRYAQGWNETDDIPGWGPGRALMDRVRSGDYAAI
jgi:hypothetical protein